MSIEQNEKTKKVFENIGDNGVWASRYGQANAVNYNFITRRNSVQGLISSEKFSSVLDIGCGTGDYCELLLQVSGKYTGVDFSSSMIESANLRYKDFPQKPIFKVGSAEALPFEDNSFDCVNAIGFIQYFDNPNVPLAEIVRVLRPGGTLIMQSYQFDLFQKILRLLGLSKLRSGLRSIRNFLLKREFLGFNVDKTYSKVALDKLAASHGLSLKSFYYNNYHLLPHFLRKMFPTLYIKGSEIVTKERASRFSIFAVNYVGKYVLEEK